MMQTGGLAETVIDETRGKRVGDEVVVVTSLGPRRTAVARLTAIDPWGVLTDREFTARSLDQRTDYSGWISTFHYASTDPGSPLCNKTAAARTETVFHVMRERRVNGDER